MLNFLAQTPLCLFVKLILNCSTRTRLVWGPILNVCLFFLVNFVFFHLFLDCYIPLWMNHLAFIRLSSCLKHTILRHGCTALSFHRRIWPVAVSSKIGSGCHSDMHCGIRVKSYMCACGLGLIKYIFSFLMQRRLLATANFMFCIMTGCSKCVEHIHFKSGEEISTKNTIIVMM